MPNSSATYQTGPSPEYLATYRVLKFLSGIVILSLLGATFTAYLMVHEIRKLTEDREIALMQMSKEVQEVRDTLKTEREQNLRWQKYVDDRFREIQKLQEETIKKTEKVIPPHVHN